jgi:hypothetical protein
MNRGLAVAMNVAAFHALWMLAVFGAGRPWWPVPPVLIGLSMAVQALRSPAPGREAVLILAGAAIGTSADWLASACGVIRPGTASRTEFLVLFFALWVNFGTTLRPSLAWMWRRPALAAVLGAVGGPCSYWVGSRIGIITFTEPRWEGLAWVAAQYAIAVPAWMLAASVVIAAQAGTGRRPMGSGASR